MATFTALFDACVLYPAPLRDLLIRLTMTNLFRAKWSDQIHDEWIRNLIKNRPDLADKLSRTRAAMDSAVPDALVRGYEPLIGILHLPDTDDRHVLAAAIAAGADVIVTFNLKDFPENELSQWNIEAVHPDDFVASQFDLNIPIVVDEIRRMRAALKKPPQSAEKLLETLANLQLPQTVERLRQFLDLI